MTPLFACPTNTAAASSPPKSPDVGTEGQKAGDVTLRVAVVFQNRLGLAAPRVVANGGPGGQGALPTIGLNGAPLPAMPNDTREFCVLGGSQRSWNDLNRLFHGAFPSGWGANYPIPAVVWCRVGDHDVYGPKDGWPDNGHPGIPGGAPGIGREGWRCDSPRSLSGQDSVSAAGGPSGLPSDTAFEREPRYSAMVIRCSYCLRSMPPILHRGPRRAKLRNRMR